MGLAAWQLNTLIKPTFSSELGASANQNYAFEPTVFKLEMKDNVRAACRRLWGNQSYNSSQSTNEITPVTTKGSRQSPTSSRKGTMATPKAVPNPVALKVYPMALPRPSARKTSVIIVK